MHKKLFNLISNDLTAIFDKIGPTPNPSLIKEGSGTSFHC